MKKSVKLLALMLGMLLLSGCVKFNVDMTINSDKSMDLNMTSAISDKVKDYYGEGESNTEDIKQKAKEKGFEVEDYKKDGFTGYTIKKHINNIDEVSTTEDVNADLSTEADNNKYFKIEKGFLKNSYKANFKSGDAESINNQTSEYANNEAYAQYMKDLELKFVLNLPSKSKSNNATTVSEDGKRLEWDLTKVKNVEFEFEVINTTNVIIVVVAAIAVIAIICGVVFFILKKKKANN